MKVISFVISCPKISGVSFDFLLIVCCLIVPFRRGFVHLAVLFVRLSYGFVRLVFLFVRFSNGFVRLVVLLVRLSNGFVRLVILLVRLSNGFVRLVVLFVCSINSFFIQTFTISKRFHISSLRQSPCHKNYLIL